MVTGMTGSRRVMTLWLFALLMVSAGLVAGCGGSAASRVGIFSGDTKSSSNSATSGDAAPSARARASTSADTASSTSAGPTRKHRTVAVGAARTRFVARAGVAFGTFHRYVYAPLKAGNLKGAKRRVALAKARAAVVSLSREVSKAKLAAGGSPALRKLFAPLAGLQASAGTLARSLGHGRTDRLDMESVNKAITNIKVLGLSSGVHIVERVPVAAP